MEKDGIVLVMNLAENYFQRIFGFLLRFLKGKAFLEGTHILRHRAMKFLVIKFDIKPDFKTFRIIITFLKNSGAGKGKPDVRGFWKADAGDPAFPQTLRGKNLMIYNPVDTRNPNFIKIVSEDGMSFIMDTSREMDFTPDRNPEKEYLSIDLNPADFDPLPVNMNTGIFSILSNIPKVFRFALIGFLIFFGLMILLTIILSFF